MYPSGSQTNLNYLYNQYDNPPFMPSPYGSPQIPNYGFVPNNPNYGYTRPSNSQRGSRSNSVLTLSKLNNDNTLDQLNISRTVILKNLNDDLTLNELLDHIDFGPIEYVKMFSKPAAKNFEKIDPSVKNLKFCFISFINSKISINFFLKYQNLQSLQGLKVDTNSKHLKVSLNDNKLQNNGLKDFIKLKTLNYILEFNATRAVNLILKYNQTFNISEFLQDLKPGLIKYGEFEDFKITEIDSNFQEKHQHSPVDCDSEFISIKVHFNSIDSAIKCYEHHLKIIQEDKEKIIENIDKSYFFLSCKFIKDRCARADNLQTLTIHDKTYKLVEESLVPSPLNDNVDLLKSLSDVEDEGENDGYFFGYKKESSGQIPISSQSNSDSNSNITSNNNSNINLSSMAYPPQPHSSSRNSHSLPLYSPFLNNSSNVSLNMQSGTFDNPNYFYNPDPYNTGNRTIYLGNLHPLSTIEEIANNVRAGGLVETIKYYPEKRNCFISFIDPNIALKFYLNHQALHQLIIHGYDITVGWAKTHSGPLSREITLAVTAGASRNVYIGIRLNKDATEQEMSVKPRLPDEEELRRDFSKFGELEQINFYHNKDCGFLNFLNIYDAIKLVELFELKNSEKISLITGDANFFDKYKDFKISFGKDRCGNPPKFSFKKKIGKSRQKVFFDSGANVPKQESSGITDEAAKVFGIIKNGDGDGDEDLKVSGIPVETNDKETELEIATESQPEQKSEARSEARSEAKSEKVIEQIVETTEPLASNIDDSLVEENLADEEAEEEFEEDDDDDISIVIGSDETSSTTAYNSNGSKDKSEKKKFYNNMVNTSDSFIPINSKRSFSNKQKSKPTSISIPQTPNGFMMPPFNGSHPPSSFPSPHMQMPQFVPQHPHSSPGLHQMHQMHQMPPPPPHPYYLSRSNSNYGYYHPQYNPMMPPPPPNPGYYYDNSPTRGSFSGSQVMAQYLAKSQSDNMFYQPNVVYDIDERRRKKS